MCHHVVAVTHDERIGHVVRLVTDESGHSMGTNFAASHCHSHHCRFLSETDAWRPDQICFLFLVSDW